MKSIFVLIVYCVSFYTFSVGQTHATEKTTHCYLCEDIQHATDLGAIERYLQQSDIRQLEDLDQEAQDWFKTFQDGSMLIDGWKDISKKVIEKTPEPQKLTIKMQLVALGVRMGCEWSKDNDIRKISTAMLKDWGGEIKEVVKKRPEEIPQVLDKIEEEVDTLLLGMK